MNYLCPVAMNINGRRKKKEKSILVVFKKIH